MKHATGYGIKQLIPLALENLNQTAWRGKKGAVELLGTMAYLDPKQLSASLSIIIPELVSVLNDTHREVRNAANASLKKFGEVIRNPEIQTLVPDLIKAIGDPTQYTEKALDGLLKTQFVHYIDGPSLALVTHVLYRGLRDRSAGVKRKACQIVGNMSILTDSRDLIPYLDTLVAELEVFYWLIPSLPLVPRPVEPLVLWLRSLVKTSFLISFLDCFLTLNLKKRLVIVLVLPRVLLRSFTVWVLASLMSCCPLSSKTVPVPSRLFARVSCL